jgi:serine/threonine protein kinase
MPTRRFRLSRIARFGGFELDLRSGELTRDGARVRLQEQPLRILTMLLEHPGEVVLRDEIRKRLWPNDTAVEIGHGINAAVLRLREALGESAENPRFIETLPRRGYRFNGQVEWENGPPLTMTGATSARATAAGTHATEAAELTGRTVSHYRVLNKLGSGGMGVVYRAEDLQLGRHVALKFLSREFAQDPAARDRFQREARAASSLNHPNVCTVYSVEECAGQPVISMELVEGVTLAALLARQPMPVSQALALAIQVAAALDAAHRKGVVHRDLKPGNLMVTTFGVKVLDFGIAKIERPAMREPVPNFGAIPAAEISATKCASVPATKCASIPATKCGSIPATKCGSIIGTPHYMSPEQLQGRETDARSDIFSFGLVLYEMLTGRRASDDGWFERSSRLSRTPGAELPQGVERVLGRCLATDPASRWQTAGELKMELERLSAQPPVPEPRRPRVWWAASAAAAALLCAGLLIARLPWPRLPWPQIFRTPVRFALTGPVENQGTRLKLSPDGRSVAFLSGTRHYVRALDRPDAQLLYTPQGLGTPFWSPDGRSVAIAEGGELVRVGLTPGSVATSLARVNTNLEGAWSADGAILIGLVNDGIYRIPASGGPPTRVTAPDAARGETRHMLPQFLSGGRRFLYIAGSDKPGGSALWAGSLDSAERTEVMPIQSSFTFVPFTPGNTQGYLLYLRDRVLVAQAFDSARLRPIAEPYALAPSVAANMAIGTLVNKGDFSATPTALVYRSGSAITVVQNWMTEVGRTGGVSASDPLVTKLSSLLSRIAPAPLPRSN